MFRHVFNLMVGPFSDAKPLLKWLVFTQIVLTIAMFIAIIGLYFR